MFLLFRAIWKSCRKNNFSYTSIIYKWLHMNTVSIASKWNNQSVSSVYKSINEWKTKVFSAKSFPQKNWSLAMCVQKRMLRHNLFVKLKLTLICPVGTNMPAKIPNKIKLNVSTHKRPPQVVKSYWKKSYVARKEHKREAFKNSAHLLLAQQIC